MIHPTAIVSPEAEIDADVTICVFDPSYDAAALVNSGQANALHEIAQWEPDEKQRRTSWCRILYASSGVLAYHLRRGEHEEALKYLEQAYAGFPDPEVAAHIVEVLAALDRREEALERLAAAEERDPESELLKDVRERVFAILEEVLPERKGEGEEVASNKHAGSI